MIKQLTVKQSVAVAQKVHASVNRATDPRSVDWNERIDSILADIDLGWKLKPTSYIDGLDCQFIGALAKTIRASAVEKY